MEFVSNLGTPVRDLESRPLMVLSDILVAFCWS